MNPRVLATLGTFLVACGGSPPPPPAPAADEPAPAEAPPAPIDAAPPPPPYATHVAPTPGLAIAQVCPDPASPDVPQVALVQSSGDAGHDRAVLTEASPAPPGTLRADPTGCTLHYRLSASQPASKPATVAAVKLQKYRASGDQEIVPSDETKVAIQQARKTKIVIPVKLCLDVDGAPTSVALLRASGFPAYDIDLLNGVATWRFRPYPIKGKPSPVCSVIVFIYQQKS